MTQASVKLTFEEYLHYDDGTDNRYELEGGALIPMTPQSPTHVLIALFLYNALNALVTSTHPDWLVTLAGVGVRALTGFSRYPDVSVVEQSVFATLTTNNVLDRQRPLLLAVEVVSPESISRDYEIKRSEYEALSIPEYWIVDRIQQRVTVLVLVGSRYQETSYTGSMRVESQIFPELALTAEEILTA